MFENISKHLFANALTGNNVTVTHLISSISKEYGFNQSKIRNAIYSANCACEINTYLTELVNKKKDRSFFEESVNPCSEK